MVPPEDPDTGSVREDLVVLLTGFAEALSHGPLAPLLTSMMDGTGPRRRAPAP